MNKQPKITLQLLSLFSVVRLYNILFIILAIYLAAIYILSPQLRLKAILLDYNLLFLTLASASSIAGGYIINNFYDSKKDSINRPLKRIIDTKISQEFKLKMYFLLNFIAVGFAILVSWRAALFFAVYIFWIWFYSHKLKRILFVGNLVASTLAIIPFFAVLLYYKNLNSMILIHATFLLLILLVREILKDLENLKGDLSAGLQTIPIKYGENIAKYSIILLLFLSLAPIFHLIHLPEIGRMRYYFYLIILALPLYSYFIIKAKNEHQYKQIHIALKLSLILGVLSIILIDYHVIISAIERQIIN